MNVISEHKNVITGVVLALIVGLSLGYGFGRQQAIGASSGTMMAPKVSATSSTSSTMMPSHSTSNTTTSGTVAEGNALSVANQLAGMSVEFSSITLSQEGWVAIRNSQGDVLGAALFPAGTHTDVSVPLLKPTASGGNYQALIYFDDGTKTFNLHTETIVLNEDGSVAGATFNAQ